MLENQSDLHFETQEADEQVELLLRAHKITNIGWIISTSFFAFLGLLAFIVNLFIGGNFGLAISGVDSLLLLLIWWMFLGVLAFQRYLSWFFNVYIVTNEKIVDVDFFNLFYKQISETPLENIQDSTQRTVGFLQNHFDYGDLVIQTAGEQENFEFLSIPDPDGTQEKLMQLSEEARKRLGYRSLNG